LRIFPLTPPHPTFPAWSGASESGGLPTFKFFQVMRLQRKRCPTLHIAALPAGAQDASRLLNEVHIPFAIDRDEVSCALVTGPCLVDHFCGHIGKTPRG